MKTFLRSLASMALLSVLVIPLTLQAGPNDVALQVNGTAFTERDVTQLAEMMSGRQPANAQERKQVIDELTVQELWAQQALQDGLDQNPDVRSRLANARRNQLASAAMAQYQQQHPVTEQQLKAEYQTLLQQFPTSTEYKARHILLKSREEAQAVIAELDRRADFAALAKQRSIGPSGVRGGELGWFTAATMVKPFSDAVAALQKGGYSRVPIQTQLGWHVILLEDVRSKQPPTFEQAKPRLRSMLNQQLLQNRVLQLKNAARVGVR